MPVKGGISPDEFEMMRLWFAKMTALTQPGLAQLPPESHPLTILDAMVQKSPATARKGLALAIGDILEDTSHLPPQAHQQIDNHLSALGLPTLSSVRWRFQARTRRIIERGKVRTENEYYAVRNIVEGIEDEAERQLVWAMLAAYEERVVVTHG